MIRLGIDTGPRVCHIAALDIDNGACPFAGDLAQTGALSLLGNREPSSIEAVTIERVVPMGLPGGQDLFHCIEKGIYWAAYFTEAGIKVYMVPCRTIRAEILEPHRGLKDDTRVVLALGLRGYLQHSVTQSGNYKVDNPANLRSDHNRDALMAALFNIRSATAEQYLYPACIWN